MFKLELNTLDITDQTDRRWDLIQDNEIGFLTIVWDSKDIDPVSGRNYSTRGGTAFIARMPALGKDGDAIILLMTAGHNV